MTEIVKNTLRRTRREKLYIKGRAGIKFRKRYEAKLCHDSFSGDVFAHTYTMAYYFVTNDIVRYMPKLSWTMDVKGHSKSLPWNVKRICRIV